MVTLWFRWLSSSALMWLRRKSLLFFGAATARSTKVFLLSYKMFWLTLFCAFICMQRTEPVQSAVKYSSRIVETRSGLIRGIVVDPERKRLEPVEIFKSIPYAKPPMGDLRFEPARKIDPWQGTLLAERFGPVCPQVSQVTCVIAYAVQITK